jgi:hypothetical protein
MKNTYRVPQKKWTRWSAQAKGVFNTVYKAIRGDHRTLFPTAAQHLPAQSVQVIAWNAAWIAADAADAQ